MRISMFRWTIVILAVGIWGVALYWVVAAPQSSAQSQAQAQVAPPTPSPTIQSRDGLPICAVGMQIQRTDWIDKYKQSIDEIAALGADAVKFVIDTRMETVKSTRI